MTLKRMNYERLIVSISLQNVVIIGRWIKTVIWLAVCRHLQQRAGATGALALSSCHISQPARAIFQICYDTLSKFCGAVIVFITHGLSSRCSAHAQ